MRFSQFAENLIFLYPHSCKATKNCLILQTDKPKNNFLWIDVIF